jgi:aflatoxin B1 aldehyde reductase
VQEVYDYANAKGSVLHTVQQGVYHLVHHQIETELLPTLRKLGIAFQAYSALVPGFLARTSASIREGESNFAFATVLEDFQEMYGW